LEVDSPPTGVQRRFVETRRLQRFGESVKQRRRNGFTLPEILVTVTVIAVLATAVTPAVSQYVNTGNAPASQQDIQQLQNATAGFTADVRHYPGDLQQLVTQIVSTNGSGDSLDLDGAATPAQFTSAETARWKGPYTSVAISTDATSGGQFTSNDLLFTIGRKISLLGAWLTVPILKPTTCAALLALNKSIDKTVPGANNESTDGIVIWDGTCSGTTPAGTVTAPRLRLAPAN
jgi:prepilin-type N-terminal cleavage/methylation domain-containing protein